MRIPSKKPGTITLGNFGQVMISVAKMNTMINAPNPGAFLIVIQMNQKYVGAWKSIPGAAVKPNRRKNIAQRAR